MAISGLMRAVGDARCVPKVGALHGKIVVSGLLSDVQASNDLVSLYLQCDRMDDACKVFDCMHNRNVVSWTLLMSGHVRTGSHVDALRCLRLMVFEGFEPNEFTYVSALSACSGIGIGAGMAGREVHGRMYRGEQGPSNVVVSNSLINFYVKCGMLCSARRVFDGIPSRTAVSWATLLAGYCQTRRNQEALQFFSLARAAGVGVNEFLYAGLLSACSGLGEVRVGKQAHCLVIKSGFTSDKYVEAGAIDMYVRCGRLDFAHRAFVESVEPGLASWTALIGGYGQHGQQKEAAGLFSQMRLSGLQYNEHTLSSLIAACANASALEAGKQVHALTVKSGFRLAEHVGNAVLDFYAKCGIVEDSSKVFGEMKHKDVVAWNALIAGYIRQGDSEVVPRLLRLMLAEGVVADHYTYSSILSLCGDIPAFQWGRQTHSSLLKPGLDHNVVVGSALIDMYAKCGRLAYARKVFERMTVRNLVSWNSMIVGYAQHGFGEEALRLFTVMEMKCVKPNDVTFLGVLTACAHMGLIEDGKRHLNSMERNYGLVPRIDHYACMVDLFARGGQIIKAYEFIMSMPIEPNKVIWRTLLSGCKVHRDMEMGKYAAECILSIDARDVSAHMMLSDVYANSELWGKKAEARGAMEGMKKVAGCSWIEVNNRIHYFTAGYKAANGICETISGISIQMMDAKYIPDEFLIPENGE